MEDYLVRNKTLEYKNESENDGKYVSAPRTALRTQEILDGKGIQRAAENFFVEKTPIILFSCSTGAENGIAKHASEKLKLDISAPIAPTNPKRIDVKFNPDGKPVFNVEYSDVATNRYVSGARIDEKS